MVSACYGMIIPVVDTGSLQVWPSLFCVLARGFIPWGASQLCYSDAVRLFVGSCGCPTAALESQYFGQLFAPQGDTVCGHALPEPVPTPTPAPTPAPTPKRSPGEMAALSRSATLAMAAIAVAVIFS